MKFAALILGVVALASGASADARWRLRRPAAPSAPVLQNFAYGFGALTQKGMGGAPLDNLLAPGSPSATSWRIQYVSGPSSTDFALPGTVIGSWNQVTEGTSALTPTPSSTGPSTCLHSQSGSTCSASQTFVFAVQAYNGTLLSNMAQITITTVPGAANLAGGTLKATSGGAVGGPAGSGIANFLAAGGCRFLISTGLSAPAFVLQDFTFGGATVGGAPAEGGTNSLVNCPGNVRADHVEFIDADPARPTTIYTLTLDDVEWADLENLQVGGPSQAGYQANVILTGHYGGKTFPSQYDDFDGLTTAYNYNIHANNPASPNYGILTYSDVGPGLFQAGSTVKVEYANNITFNNFTCVASGQCIDDTGSPNASINSNITFNNFSARYITNNTIYICSGTGWTFNDTMIVAPEQYPNSSNHQDDLQVCGNGTPVDLTFNRTTIINPPGAGFGQGLYDGNWTAGYWIKGWQVNGLLEYKRGWTAAAISTCEPSSDRPCSFTNITALKANTGPVSLWVSNPYNAEIIFNGNPVAGQTMSLGGRTITFVTAASQTAVGNPTSQVAVGSTAYATAGNFVSFLKYGTNSTALGVSSPAESLGYVSPPYVSFNISWTSPQWSTAAQTFTPAVDPNWSTVGCAALTSPVVCEMYPVGAGDVNQPTNSGPTWVFSNNNLSTAWGGQTVLSSAFFYDNVKATGDGNFSYHGLETPCSNPYITVQAPSLNLGTINASGGCQASTGSNGTAYTGIQTVFAASIDASVPTGASLPADVAMAFGLGGSGNPSFAPSPNSPIFAAPVGGNAYGCQDPFQVCDGNPQHEFESIPEATLLAATNAQIRHWAAVAATPAPGGELDLTTQTGGSGWAGALNGAGQWNDGSGITP